MLDLLTVNMDMAQSGIYTAVPKLATEFGLIEIQAPSDRNIFILCAVVQFGPGAFFQRSVASLITTQTGGPHPASPVDLASEPSRIQSTAVGKSGRMTGGPIPDGLYIPSNSEDTKVAVMMAFPVPLGIPAGMFISMVCAEADEDVSYGMNWVEIPVRF